MRYSDHEWASFLNSLTAEEERMVEERLQSAYERGYDDAQLVCE